MSVEQTSQLIQLIMNSVLMGVVCALVLNGMSARCAALEEAWRRLDEEEREVRYASRRKLWRRLHQRLQVSHYSVLAGYYALLFSLLSLLLLALRAVLQFDLLVSGAIGLFGIGVTALLLSVGLGLIEMHWSDLPMLEEFKGLLSSGALGGNLGDRPSSRPENYPIPTYLPKLPTRSRRRVG
jgi:uncharacterized BrkB/YihY/UPF0761 family membrane protein